MPKVWLTADIKPANILVEVSQELVEVEAGAVSLTRPLPVSSSARGAATDEEGGSQTPFARRAHEFDDLAD